MKAKSPRAKAYTLGELILAVSSCSKTRNEAVAVVADLLQSGQCRFTNNNSKVKIE